MLRTYFIDGDKGGIGKTFLCHLLVDFYLYSNQNNNESEYCLVLFDADLVNKDFSTYPIRRHDGKLIPCFGIDLSIIEGWQFLERKLLRYIKNNQSARAIINCPGNLLNYIKQCDSHEVGAIMTRINMLPLWIFNRSPLCLLNLQERQRLLPLNYKKGVAILNLYFGNQVDFLHWNLSQFRNTHITKGEWIEITLPTLNHEISAEFSGMPIKNWFEYGYNGKQPSMGLKLAFNCFLKQSYKTLSLIESLEVI
ncbi:hypothetical protein LHV13_03270 [Ferrovum sp. PN-J185]|uniref:hypothetical protein n=1 Tax=Ferrovum sp. PN-J185 TaxID=1356306 RepID=UPI0007913604|nr:hypothetical protein [Ferrovum sp. PN-J185]KXW56455.1 hypothetical protein FV185_04040 [Ferrovum sp. PN-J185]MCC6068196.1 hypothetical protein [Ferrovum sp. PN-J185]MDE1891691.1 hypothetical protein [Betaproteobacteria bacterium]MDE2056467.1 hypothetical protein [Betaproteobacteria bacterium]